jgi:rare lipoprotein A
MKNILILIFFCPLLSWAQRDSVSTGTASFYANKFEGRKTSSDERFCQDSLTCAHKYLPFGSYIKVTNLSNDSVVVVKVNDRLPKSSKRCVDLTRSAAKQLNFIAKGLTKVRIEVLAEKPKSTEAIEKSDN